MGLAFDPQIRSLIIPLCATLPALAMRIDRSRNLLAGMSSRCLSNRAEFALRSAATFKDRAINGFLAVIVDTQRCSCQVLH